MGRRHKENCDLESLVKTLGVQQDVTGQKEYSFIYERKIEGRKKK
jgi:hypothetical protein